MHPGHLPRGRVKALFALDIFCRRVHEKSVVAVVADNRVVIAIHMTCDATDLGLENGNDHNRTDAGTLELVLKERSVLFENVGGDKSLFVSFADPAKRAEFDFPTSPSELLID